MDPALQELLQEDQDPNDEIEAIIRLVNRGNYPTGIRIVAEFGEVITCRVKRKDIRAVYDQNTVKSFKASRVFANDCGCNESLNEDENNFYNGVETSLIGETQHTQNAAGEGAVIGIIDWGGDFAHADFVNADGTTRFLALWDQSYNLNASSPQPYNYGKLFTREIINRALATNNPYQTLGYHPAKADTTGNGSHGTHVMGIAAANGRSGTMGVAPKAEIIFVHLASNDTDGTYNLGDSVRILEAIDFIHKTAGTRPLVMNLSVGKHGGPHDGTTLVEQAMDYLLDNNRNRSICQSTGNYYSSKTHASGIVKPGQSFNLMFHVDAADVTPNELEVWYSGKDVFDIILSNANNAQRFSCSIDKMTPIKIDGRLVGRIYHRSNDPNNHKNHIDIFLYREALPGDWTLQITGKKIVDGRFDSWIERDGGCRHCQSVFIEQNIVRTSTTNTICNGYNTIVSGAYNTSGAFSIPAFSSSGPTVDGRIKPNLLSPGVNIRSSRSAPRNSVAGWNNTVVMSGTSMASPRVTGTVAVILGLLRNNPQDNHVIRKILFQSCSPLTSNIEPARSGYGILNIENTIVNTLQLIKHRPQHESHENESEAISNYNSRIRNFSIHKPPASAAFTETTESTAFVTFDHKLNEQYDFVRSRHIASTADLKPELVANSFYNTANGTVIADEFFQEALDKIINDNQLLKQNKNSFSVSVVDLSRSKKFKPLYAGFNSYENYYAASTAKVTGLYAAFQLRADMNSFIKTKTIRSIKELEAESHKIWKSKGIKPVHFPLIKEIFDFNETADKVNFKPDLLRVFNDLSHGNQNGSIPILLLGYHYITSCLLAAGLFTAADGGLFVRKSYGGAYYNHQPLKGTEWGKDNPFKKFAIHNVNAISVTQLLTLIAQFRLIDQTSSYEMLDCLGIYKGGCISNVVTDFFKIIKRGNFIAAKCGIYGGFWHVPMYYHDDQHEFVLTILTKNYKSKLIDLLATEIYNKMILKTSVASIREQHSVKKSESFNTILN